MKKLTPRQQYWSELINDWQVSGLSQVEFCRSKELDPHAFYNWKSTLKRIQQDDAKEPGSFLPIVLAEQPTGIPVSINQVELNFDSSTDEQLFIKLVRLLREAA